MARTFMFEGQEHTWVPANPNMNGFRILRDMERGEHNPEESLLYFVKLIDGKPAEEAEEGLQWKAYFEGFYFLTVVTENNPDSSSSS